MENIKMFKDGERFVIVFEQVSKETEEIVQEIMLKYTQKKIQMVEGVSPIPEEKEEPLNLNEKNKIENKPKSVQQPILRFPTGAYKNMTVEEVIQKKGIKALSEMKKECDSLKNAQQKALFNAVLHKKLSTYVEETKKIGVNNLSEEDIDLFLDILNAFTTAVKEIAMQAGCGNFESFLLCEAIESKKDAVQTILEKFNK